MSKQQRVFKIAGNNKGLMCPFKPILCQEGYCHQCQIYLDWRELGEFVAICAWCGKEIGRKAGLGRSGVSHGICPECAQKYLPDVRVRTESPDRG